MLKFISVVEGHFKVIGMYLNMHFLEATNTKPKSLLETRTLDDMVKLFFKPVSKNYEKKADILIGRLCYVE